MNKQLIGFPSIKQFRNVMSSIDRWFVDELKLERPVINFRGTVKIHGKNMSIVRLPSGEIQVQTKRTVIDSSEHPSNEQNGMFYDFAFKEVGIGIWQRFFDVIIRRNPHWADMSIGIYMEYAGNGINKGHAIHRLSKRVFIFGIKAGSGLDEFGKSTEDSEWLDLGKYRELELPDKNVFNIENFKTWDVKIDFKGMGDYADHFNEYNRQLEELVEGDKSTNHLIEPDKPQVLLDLEKLSEEVQQVCPVGEFFDLKAEKNLRIGGEGIVWKAVDPQIPMNHVLDYYNFKIVPHSSKNPKKRRNTVTVSPEKMSSIDEFVNAVLTDGVDGRLEQGLSILQEDGYELSKKSTGKFLSWIVADIEKEESDTLMESGIGLKDVENLIKQRSREWFFKQLH